ncbi:MAG: hypothetical protein AB2720_11595 [Candidatus Thiodiazotropha taylori]
MLNLFRRIAISIHATNDGAHAGAGYHIDGDAERFEYFQYPDMRSSPCTATAQHKPDQRAVEWLGCCSCCVALMSDTNQQG